MSSDILPEAEAARKALGDALYAYLIGAADDRVGPNDRNAAEFARYALMPSLLSGAGQTDLSVSFGGRELAAPLVVGAFAADRIFHEEGLRPVARVCQRLGLALIASEETVTPLEAVTALNPATWLQLRAAGDFERIGRIVEGAKAQGVAGIVITLLAPTHPRPVLRPGGYDVGAELRRRGWSTIGTQLDGSNIAGPAPLPAWPRWGLADVSALARLCEGLGLPLVLKGVLNPDDAAQLVQTGLAGQMVSNIGLRQSGRWVTPLTQLPKIAARIPDATLMLDGGIRQPADMIVASILGARLYVVSRPVLTALAGGGEAAVEAWLMRMLDGLHAMLCWMGAASLGDLGPEQLVGPG